MHNLRIILAISILLSGCSIATAPLAEYDKSVGPLVSFIFKWQFEDKQRAADVFNFAQVHCESAESCPDSSGALYIKVTSKESTLLSGCSTELTSDGQLITNAHCIPKDLAHDGAHCEGRIKVKFPANSRVGFEQFECDQVLKISKDHGFVEQPDWALLTFKGQTSRQGAEIKPQPMEKNRPVDIYKVDFQQQFKTATIIRSSCYANTNHRYQFEHTGPVSPIMNVSHCNQRMIKGNSGSAIKTPEGQIVGVFSFVTDIEQTLAASKHPKLKQNFGGGTNFVCSSPIEVSDDPRCDYRPGRFLIYGKQYQKLEQWRAYRRSRPRHAEQVAARFKKKVGVYKLEFKDWDDEFFDQAQFDGLEELDGVGQTLLKETFEMMLPQVPRCVKSHRSLFVAYFPVEEPTENIKMDEDNFSATRQSQIIDRAFEFKKDSKGVYQVSGQLRAGALSFQREVKTSEDAIQVLQGIIPIHFEVPSCDSLESTQ